MRLSYSGFLLKRRVMLIFFGLMVILPATTLPVVENNPLRRHMAVTLHACSAMPSKCIMRGKYIYIGVASKYTVKIS